MPIDLVQLKARLNFTRSTLVIWIVAISVVLSAGLSAHLIRADAAGDAVWNGKEAYLFIYRERLGWHVKWIGYPLMIAGEFFRYIEPPNDWRGTMYVIRVTSSAVERHVLELTDRRPGSGPNMLTPIGGRIWASFPALGGLCWWAGDHFERATQEESRRLGGIEHFYHLDNRAYRDENGWSKAGVASELTVVIKLDDGTEVSAYGGQTPGAFSIEMRRQSGESNTIFRLENSSGLVSRSGYQHAFRDPE